MTRAAVAALLLVARRRLTVIVLRAINTRRSLRDLRAKVKAVAICESVEKQVKREKIYDKKHHQRGDLYF